MYAGKELRRWGKVFLESYFYHLALSCSRVQVDGLAQPSYAAQSYRGSSLARWFTGKERAASWIRRGSIYL